MTFNVDTVESAGIIVIAIALIYVIIRFQRTLDAGRSELKQMILAQQSTLEGQREIHAELERLNHRLAEVEARTQRKRKPPEPKTPVTFLRAKNSGRK